MTSKDEPRKVTRYWQLLPHEVAFNALLLVLALRLSWAAGPANLRVAAFLAYIAVGIALVVWTQRDPTPTRWRIRLLWYPCAMGLTFYSLAGTIEALGVTRADELLARWDAAILGAPAAHYLAALETPLFTEIMVIAYLFFFYYLIFGPAHYCLRDLQRFRSCFAGLFTLYALGFLGYSLFPAHGPRADVTLPAMQLGPLARHLLPLVDAGSNDVDVFPSIHGAASLYLLVFDAWHYRRRFWQLLLPTIALWFSTVYLRYHYAVDLAAGLAIAVAALLTARCYERSSLAAAIERSAVREPAAGPKQVSDARA